jgi:hypothetical protein
MRRISLPAWLLLSVISYSSSTLGADQEKCPIEQVVGQIHMIAGDRSVIHLHRGRREIPVAPNACILYGDRLVVGMSATVTIDSAKGSVVIGDDSEQEWQVPAAHGAASPSVTAFLDTLFHGVLTAARPHADYLMSRGLAPCPPSSNAAPPLQPLERLRHTEQQIGADLPVLGVAWAPSRERRDVAVRLTTSDGQVIANDHTCRDSHLFLPLPTAQLHAGDHLALEVTDKLGGALRYDISVIAPDELPRPPVPIADDWLVAAWRLAAIPETRLDAISRIQGAQTDALVASRILEDVWADVPF